MVARTGETAIIMDLHDSMMLIGRGRDGSSQNVRGNTIVARHVILPKAFRESMSHQGASSVSVDLF
jgi:hypothetical protein